MDIVPIVESQTIYVTSTSASFSTTVIVNPPPLNMNIPGFLENHYLPSSLPQPINFMPP